MQILRFSEQSAGPRVLRLWLGGTFLYAGVQKLADPGFLHEGSRTYIGAQLDGFAQISPIGGLLDLLARAPVAVGLTMALAEILVGLATLSGVMPATAALGGAALALGLWVSVTWEVYPYYLGSDSIYLVAWVAYLLSLPASVSFLSALRQRRRPQLLPFGSGTGGSGPGQPDSAARSDARRTVLRGAAVIVGGLAIAGIAGLRGRSRDAGTVDGAPTAPGTSAPSPTTTGTGSPTGSVVADVATLEREGATRFTDPVLGDAVVVALPGAAPVAFSTRCTHSGCAVNYDGSSGLLDCPCHGSRFDPANGGSPVRGPATRALEPVPVEVDAQNGVVRRA